MVAALRGLPAVDRDLLGLRFDALLSYQDIGRVMGMSEEEVLVGLLRALQRLRDRMGGAASGSG